MTRIIAPTRHVSVTDDNGRTNLRFAEFLEDLANTVNDLTAIPINSQDSSYTLVFNDAGVIIRNTTATAQQTYTIPANTDVTFEIGTRIEIQNDGTTILRIAITTDTLTSEAGLGTGIRTLAAAGSAILTKVEDTVWKIRGQQLT